MSEKISEEINTEACNDKLGDAAKKAVIESRSNNKREAITPKYKVGDRVGICVQEFCTYVNVPIVKILPKTQAGTFVYEVKEDRFYKKLPLKRNIYSEYEIFDTTLLLSQEEINIKNKLFLIIENTDCEEIFVNDFFYKDHISNYFTVSLDQLSNGITFYYKKITPNPNVGYGKFLLKGTDDELKGAYGQFSLENLTDYTLQKLRNGKPESELSAKIRNHLNIKSDTLHSKLSQESEIANEYNNYRYSKEIEITKAKLELICENTKANASIVFNKYYYEGAIKRCLTINPGKLSFDFNGRSLVTNRTLGIGSFQLIDNYTGNLLSEPMSFDNLTEANLRKLRSGHFETNRSKELRAVLGITDVTDNNKIKPEPIPEPAVECLKIIPVESTTSISEAFDKTLEKIFLYVGTTLGLDQCTINAGSITGDGFKLNVNGDSFTLTPNTNDISTTKLSSSVHSPIWNDQTSTINFPDIDIGNVLDIYEKIQTSLREGLKSFIGADSSEESKKVLDKKVIDNQVNKNLSFKDGLLKIWKQECSELTKTVYVSPIDYLSLKDIINSDSAIRSDYGALKVIETPIMLPGFIHISSFNHQTLSIDFIRKTFGYLYSVADGPSLSGNDTIKLFEKALAADNELKLKQAEDRKVLADSIQKSADYLSKFRSNLEKLDASYCSGKENIILSVEDYNLLLINNYDFHKNRNVYYTQNSSMVPGFACVLNEHDIKKVSNINIFKQYIQDNPVYLYSLLDTAGPFGKMGPAVLKKINVALSERLEKSMIKNLETLPEDLKKINLFLKSISVIIDGEILYNRMSNTKYENLMEDIISYIKSYKADMKYSMGASKEGNEIYNLLNCIKDPSYHSKHFSEIFTFIDRLVDNSRVEQTKELLAIIKELFRFHAGLTNRDPRKYNYNYFFNPLNNSKIDSEIKSDSNREAAASEIKPIQTTLVSSKAMSASEILQSFFSPFTGNHAPKPLTTVNLTESIENNNMDKTASFVSDPSTKKTLMQEGREAFDVAKWRVAQRQAVRRFRDLLIVGLNQVGKDRSEVKALEKALKTKTGEGLISLCISFLSRMDMFAKHRNAEKFFTECRVEGLTVVSDEALEAFVGSAFPMIMGFISSSLDELPSVSVEVKQKPKKVRIHTAKKNSEMKDASKEEHEAEEEVLANDENKQARKIATVNP